MLTLRISMVRCNSVQIFTYMYCIYPTVNALEFQTLYCLLFCLNFFMQLFFTTLSGMANSVDPDQTPPSGAV